MHSALLADRVSLKNGKVIENVKTTIEKSAVKLKYENGKVESLSKSEVKSLKIAAVQWKPIAPATPGTAGPTAEQLAKEAEEEKARVAEASERGDEFTPRADEELVSPWGNFALGLIPGYSGLYRTQNTGRAITFSVLETMALFYAADVTTAKRAGDGFGQFQGGGLIFLGIQTQSGAISGNPSVAPLVIGAGFYFGNATYGYEGGLSGTSYARLQNTTNAERSIAAQRQAAYGVLGFILLVDAVSSYFAADSWNEGTYGGKSLIITLFVLRNLAPVCYALPSFLVGVKFMEEMALKAIRGWQEGFYSWLMSLVLRVP